MMAGAQADMSDADAYRAALRLNWRLWTIIQADVSAPENPLPSDIKQNILSLSVFIDKHTVGALAEPEARSEEHTSELQSLMRNSYAVFCLKKKTKQHTTS